MSCSKHPTVRCPVHNAAMVRKANTKGGIFYGCECFESQGCVVSWSDRDQRFWNDPRVVAPASARHSRVVSKRADVTARAVAQGLPLEDVEQPLAECGLEEVMRLVA